ncbi:MAG: Rrf2 family transcriptional regulator [Gemmatimonadales bacterium]
MAYLGCHAHHHLDRIQPHHNSPLAKRLEDGGGPMPARELAAIEGLPADYTEQIFLRLRRAGLVKSVRGAKGGYYLGRAAEEISVRDVMEACERQTFEINCQVHPVDPDRCNPSTACSIRPVWAALQQQIDEFLSGITLADLMKREARVQELVGIASD